MWRWWRKKDCSKGSFSAYVEFSEKLTLLTPWHTHVRVRTQLEFICSKSTIETLEKDGKYVQSYQ